MIQTGSKVRIKEWDDMVKEFGYDSCAGSINVVNGFSRTMKHLCGLEFEVEDIRKPLDYEYEEDDILYEYEEDDILMDEICPVYDDKLEEECHKRYEELNGETHRAFMDLTFWIINEKMVVEVNE